MSAVSSKSTRYSQPVHLCEHCMQRVDDADYDNFCASNDGGSPSGELIQPDDPDAEPASAAIARALSQVLDTASDEQRPVVISVVKHLLSPRKKQNHKFRADPSELAKNLGVLAEKEGFFKELPSSPEAKEEPEVVCDDPVGLEQKENPPLADSSGRQYTLQYADVREDNTEDVESAEETEADEPVEDIIELARHPVPADESSRQQWMDKHPNIFSRLMELPELELLCNVARTELQCDTTMVCVFSPDTCYVVACTDPSWRGFELPREHAICGHTLMSDAPLLVRHPEADVRFSAMDDVRRFGVRFYFGFPIKIYNPENGDSIAVGTFCCINTSGAREVSESQYALMATIVEGATRVLEYGASRLLEG
ncbi:unnamed protein product [Phytophthora lilii]|uniref:Unnamed protein product n=1 Tax=Phytophthora lilii TaxID=2077276 RepID=A0A9W6UDW8_9STRA|nr:unnamed protein product [Phytophthora lilii]